MRMEKVRWRDDDVRTANTSSHACTRWLYRHARKMCQKHVRATRGVCTVVEAHAKYVNRTRSPHTHINVERCVQKLSVIWRWVTHREAGCLHWIEYFGKQTHIAVVNARQSQLQSVKGRSSSGARTILSFSSASVVFVWDAAEPWVPFCPGVDSRLAANMAA